MPSVITYDKDAALRQGITSAGSALGNAMAYNAQQKNLEEQRQNQMREAEAKNQQYGTILSETLSTLPQDASAMDIVGKFTEMANKGVPMEYLKGIFPLIEPQIKGSIQSDQQRMFLESMGLAPPRSAESRIPKQMQFEGMAQPGIPQPASPMGQAIQPVQQPAAQMNPMQSQQQPIPQQNVFQRATEDQLIAMQSSGIPQIQQGAKAEQDRRNSERKDFRADRDFAYKRAGKFLENIDESRKTVGDQSEALNLMENAVKEGNTEFFSKDNFANFLGKYGEGLRTAKGAQLLNAQKEFLVSDIGRVGNRPNMWIEQQISGALTKIGRSDEANLTVVEALRSRNDRDKKRIEVTDALEQQYMKPPSEGGLGYVPGNIASLVDQAMKPYNEQIQKRLAYKIRQYNEMENRKDFKSMMNKKPVQGTPLTLPMMVAFKNKYNGDIKAARKNAKAMGYDILDEEEYAQFDPENYALIMQQVEVR